MLVFISTSGRKVRNLIGVSTINLQIEIQQIDDHCRHLAVWCHKIAVTVRPTVTPGKIVFRPTVRSRR